MTWTPDQKILNRVQAINRNLMETQWLLGRLLGENKVLMHGLRKNQKFTPSELDRLQYLNDRQLQQGVKLRKLLDLAEGKR